MSAEEQAAVERLAHSRTAPARLVERARIIWHGSQGLRVPAIALRLTIDETTVRRWLKRFNAQGLAALADAPRPGHPATYPPEQVAELSRPP